jgi:hypothetical protein
MNKFFNLLIAVAIICMLTACGGNKKTKPETAPAVTINPKTTVLKGNLKNYFEVADREYELVDNSFGHYEITVELKRNSISLPFSTDNINPFGTNGGEDYHVGFGIEIFDEKGVPAFIENATDLGGRDDVESIMKLGENETGFIRFLVKIIEGKTYKTFQISSAVEAENGKKLNWNSIDKAIETSKKAMDAVNDAADWDDIDKAIETSKKAMDIANDAAKLMKDLQ